MRIVSWYNKLSDAIHEAQLRQMPILEVEQPRGRKPLYLFGWSGKGIPKKYYVVTSAPKTVIAELAREGIQAKQLPDKLITRKAKRTKRASAWR